MRGKDALGAEDLLGCFDLESAPNATVASYLREVIAALDQAQRWLLLRFCTAQSALPAR